MPFLTDQQRQAQYDEAVALARRPIPTAADVDAARARLDERIAAAGRKASVTHVKDTARRYDRERDLSRATGVYREFCAAMPRAEAIRRLTDALHRERGAYADGLNGSLVNVSSSRVSVLFIKAALLCERLARRRDAAQASAFMNAVRAA